MNQKYFIGSDAKKSSEGISLPEISKIILVVDEESAFEAGDDTGYALEVYCPYGTQQMANDLLAQAHGFVYTGYSAESVQLPPEAELGDGIVIGSIYGMLASRKFSFTPKLTENISAPLEKEVEHEYSYEGTLTKEMKRKLTLGASYYGTSITRQRGLEIKHYDALGNPTTRVTLNSETLAFYNANGSKAFYYDSTTGEFKISSTIVVGLDEYEKKAELSTDISTYIDSTAGTAKIVSACSATYLSKTDAADTYETITAVAQISQSVSDVQSEISLSADFGSGTVGSNVRALLQLVSNADTSSIEIKADKINFTGVTTFVRPGDNISELNNNSGYQTSSGVTTIIGDTVTTGYIEALNIKVNAVQIEGTLTIGQLPSSVATTSDIPTDVSELNNDSGYQTESGVVSIVDGRITADYVEALGITVGAAQISGKLTASQIDASELKVDAANITGQLTASQIDASALKVGAANITGTLTIGQLPESVAEIGDIPTDTGDLTNEAGFQTASQVTTITQDTVTTAYVNALNITALGTVTAGIIQSSNYISGTSGLKIDLTNGNADITGKITATSGSMQNMTITGRLTFGGNSSYYIDANYNDGSYYIKLPGFKVDDAGGAIFSGSLSAAKGTFAGELSAASGTFHGSMTSTGVNDNTVTISDGYISMNQNWTTSLTTSRTASSAWDTWSNGLITLQCGVTSNPIAQAWCGTQKHAIYFSNDNATLSGTWLGTSSIAITSDANRKHDISDMTEAYSVLFDKLHPRLYRYDDGTSNRIHVGFVAQEVETAIAAAGLTTNDFAAFVRAEVYNKETEKIETVYMLRYEEFIALNTEEIKKLKARMAELKDIVTKLQRG